MSWDWPTPTSSYALEAEGYAAVQDSVRFVTIDVDPADHRTMRRLHLRARMIRRYGPTVAAMSDTTVEKLRTLRPGDVLSVPIVTAQGSARSHGTGPPLRWDHPEAHRRLLRRWMAP